MNPFHAFAKMPPELTASIHFEPHGRVDRCLALSVGTTVSQAACSCPGAEAKKNVVGKRSGMKPTGTENLRPHPPTLGRRTFMQALALQLDLRGHEGFLQKSWEPRKREGALHGPPVALLACWRWAGSGCSQGSSQNPSLGVWWGHV